ncbi:hypothetical protein [Piscirickettsia salmonis]|uniref:hypothetical protein n=1 Tax=Piscirickettsia salmonis TaxID=1238 RepID=UPI0016625026|nr:hypothetical protein [Piscirickettsia salmonis]QNR81717.1 hypothetical protein ICC15_07320 [Piscirickettsia salmonis]QNR82540.1 hypothetical protein ICC15_18980 [Piscirickettsia salmonis]
MLATYLKDEHKLSLVVACNLVTLPRASYYRKKQHQSDNAEIISELKTLASKHKRWGCDKMVAYLKTKVSLGTISAFVESILKWA